MRNTIRAIQEQLEDLEQNMPRLDTDELESRLTDIEIECDSLTDSLRNGWLTPTDTADAVESIRALVHELYTEV